VQAGPNVAQDIFSIPTGSVSKIKMPGQQSLIYVEEKTNPVEKYKLAVVNMPVIVSDKTQNNIDNELNQLVSEPDIRDNFTQLAQEKGYNVIPSQTVGATDHIGWHKCKDHDKLSTGHLMKKKVQLKSLIYQEIV
jgi:peptidyl-prolyl cis-trans isomerase D